MSNETYLNHPIFGLLFRVCLLDSDQELFTTLYAQRLFFLVTTTSENTLFETISRSDCRMMVENRLRLLRRTGSTEEYTTLFDVYKRIFQ